MIVEIVGRSADIVLIVVLAVLVLLGLRLSQTLLFLRRYWDAGLAREEAALRQSLPREEDLPAVLVQIPAYDEGALVERAVAAATALDWPRDRLQIQLLDDSSGSSAEIARATARRFQELGHDVVLIQRTDRTGFKAGALKAGLARTGQLYVAIFDADYVPRPDFLQRCMPALLSDPGLAFVQARCDFLNAEQNRLTRAQKMILESHFAGEQPTRSWAGQILPFNGTCGIWRRAAIEDAGGWQGDTLTEDLDLSYRAQLEGWRALFLVSVAVPGELPDTLSEWLTQQRRWNKGYAQSVRKLVPATWHSGLPWYRKLGASLFVCGCIHAPLSVLAAASGILDLALGTMSYSIVIPLSLLAELQGVAGAVLLARISNRLLRLAGDERPRKVQFGVFLYTLLLHARVALLTARSVVEGLLGRRSAFVRTPKRGSRAAAANDAVLEETIERSVQKTG